MSKGNRNFRLGYLASLGFKEAKTSDSLEAIFSGQVIDLSKLHKFCGMFDLPTNYRPQIWKILLGIFPPHKEAWETVQQQRNEEYQDIKRTVEVIRFGIPDEVEDFSTVSTTEKEHSIEKRTVIFTNIYFTRQVYFLYSDSPLFKVDANDLASVARVINRLSDDEADCFWLFSSFINFITQYYPFHEKESTVRNNGTDSTTISRLLEIHDKEVFNHLAHNNITIDQLAYPTWLRDFFVGYFPTETVLRIWDRAVGVSGEFLGCFFVAMICSDRFRPLILASESLNQLLTLFHNVDSLNQYVDLWIKAALEIYTGSQT